MVKEKLRKALEDAVGYYNDGLSANDAVVKSASEHDLTVDQADRVVESFNTAKTINYYEKSGSDRTGSFDLASKKDVTLALFGKVPEKTAQASQTPVSDPDLLSDAFYTSAPDRTGNRKQVFADKRAGLLDTMAKVAEEKWKHGYSDRTIQDMASDAYAVIKSAEADIESALGTIDSYLWTATEKIASDLAKGPYEVPEDRANLFKAACPHKIVVDQVSRFCPLLKKADGGIYAKMHVVDTAPVDELLKEADDIVEAVKQRKEYREKLAEFRAKGERLKAAMFSDPSLSDKVTRAPDPFDSMLHAPKAVKQAADKGFNFYGTVKDTGGLLDEMVTGKSRKDVNEKIRDDIRGAILSDLLSSDQILQDADPRQVAAIYKSLVATSPRVSLNKEIVRSVLRSAVNSVALSPADSKILTDVDKGVQLAYAGTGGVKEDE